MRPLKRRETLPPARTLLVDPKRMYFGRPDGSEYAFLGFESDTSIVIDGITYTHVVIKLSKVIASALLDTLQENLT